MCEPSVVPGIIMAAIALLLLIFGTHLQRIAAILCLIISVYLAYVGYQSTITRNERIEQALQLIQQQIPTK